MGKKLTVSDHPTEDLYEAIRQIMDESIKLRKAMDRKGPDALDDKFRMKKESKILKILDPEDTEKALRQIWNYPVLTENYDKYRDLIAQCPYVLLGALETDLVVNVDLNQPTRLWLFELLRRYYPEMLMVTQTGDVYLYLPYTVNIREGALIPLIGQGPFTSKTIASLGQRLIKALVIKGNPVNVYIATDNIGCDMSEFNPLKRLRDLRNCNLVTVPQAERVIMNFMDGIEEKGATVILTQGAIRANDIYRNLMNNRKLSQNGNNMYIVACFSDADSQEHFNLVDSCIWQRSRLIKNLSFTNLLTERLIPFRIDQKI